jgi:hypothetical protein
LQHYLKADLKKVKPVDGKMTSTDLHFTTKREIVASEGSTRKPHQYVARHTFNPKKCHCGKVTSKESYRSVS